MWKKIKAMRDNGQKEYARKSDDVHANFKRISSYTNISVGKVIMTYLLKHIDGINAHIDGHESQREDVEGRIIDSIVYLFLLWGYITAERKVSPKSKHWVVSNTPGVDFEDATEK